MNATISTICSRIVAKSSVCICLFLIFLKNLRCKTTFSPRSNTFFSVEGVNGPSQKLTLKQIFKILYYWAMDHTILATTTMARISNPTASYWFKKIREICQSSFETRSKLGGEGYIVEIDESLLRGKRKANRGRYLTGDKWKVSSNKEFLPLSNNSKEFIHIFNICLNYNILDIDDISGSEYLPTDVEFSDDSSTSH